MTHTTHKAHRRMLRMRERLMEAYPKCFMPFGEIKRPLKIGIHQDLLDFASDAYEMRDVRRALADYVTGKGYYRAILPGAIRVDLNGEPAGVVGEGAAFDAARKLRKIERREFAAKREAERVAAKAEAEKRAAEKAARKAESEAAAKRAAEKRAQPRPAQRQHRKVEVEVIRRRPGVPGVTRRFA